jgi:ABC-type antimicrobial peptide transport system permease subunit
MMRVLRALTIIAGIAIIITLAFSLLAGNLNKSSVVVIPDEPVQMSGNSYVVQPQVTVDTRQTLELAPNRVNQGFNPVSDSRYAPTITPQKEEGLLNNSSAIFVIFGVLYSAAFFAVFFAILFKMAQRKRPNRITNRLRY